MLVTLAVTIAIQAQTSPTAERPLIWSDEFNGKGLPDAAKWGNETGRVRNREDQFYTVDRPENARQEGGNLVIEARKEPWQGAQVTSASLTSKPAWKNVYFEVRAKLPTGRGTWPAIWFLGEGHRIRGQRGWPFCGEIDLMEYVGYLPDKLHFTIHTGAADDKSHASKGTNITVPDVWKDFHTYGLDWKPDHLDMYFDGKLVFTYRPDPNNPNSWPFNKPAYLLLNLAIGGSWGGSNGVDDAIFPAKFLVDYVRVYR
jgi:beta-glucanase (GH16 family)